MGDMNAVVRDIMTEHVVTVKDSMAAKDAAHLMLRDRISGVPVVDEKGDLCGVVTTTDLFRALENMILDTTFGSYKGAFHSKMVTVGSIMTRKLITISPDSLVHEVVKLSVYKNIHFFPVIENEKLVGVVGKRDILNAGFTLIS